MQPDKQSDHQNISTRHVYTAKQFHEEIIGEQMSLNGIYNAMKTGEIPFTKIGKLKLIPGEFAEKIRST